MLQPCFCPRCVPRKATGNRANAHPLDGFTPFRIGAPVPGKALTSNDGLLELWVPLTRRICQHRPAPTRDAKPPTPAMRYQRALAFLYRCLMLPEDIPPASAYMAKPPENFTYHHMLHPDIINIRTVLLNPPDDSTYASRPAFIIPGEEPWRVSAMRTVNVLTALPNLPPILRRMARGMAAPHAHAHPAHGRIVQRAVTEPRPLVDVWPWVPGWHPASFVEPPLARSANAPEGYYETRLRPVLREWWNANAHILRPDAFSAHDLDRHLDYVEQAFVTADGD